MRGRGGAARGASGRAAAAGKSPGKNSASCDQEPQRRVGACCSACGCICCCAWFALRGVVQGASRSRNSHLCVQGVLGEGFASRACKPAFVYLMPRAPSWGRGIASQGQGRLIKQHELSRPVTGAVPYMRTIMKLSSCKAPRPGRLAHSPEPHGKTPAPENCDTLWPVRGRYCTAFPLGPANNTPRVFACAPLRAASCPRL